MFNVLFSYANFQRSWKHHCYELSWHMLLQECFWSRSKTCSTCFIGSKTTRLRLVVLNPNKTLLPVFKTLHYSVINSFISLSWLTGTEEHGPQEWMTVTNGYKWHSDDPRRLLPSPLKAVRTPTSGSQIIGLRTAWTGYTTSTTNNLEWPRCVYFLI